MKRNTNTQRNGEFGIRDVRSTWAVEISQTSTLWTTSHGQELMLHYFLGCLLCKYLLAQHCPWCPDTLSRGGHFVHDSRPS